MLKQGKQMDIKYDLEVLIHQARATRNLQGVRATHLRRAVKEIERLRAEVFELRRKLESARQQ